MQIRSVLAVLAMCWAGMAQAADDGSQIEVQYCGVGYLGQAKDLKANYPYLESNLLSEKDRPQYGGTFKTLMQDANKGLKFVDSSNEALSFVVASATYEYQEYRNPIPPNNQMFNVIYTLKMQTVLFNKDSKEVRGVYPWTYQFNDAMPSKPTTEEVSARFKSFLEMPPELKEGEEPDAQLFMNQWRQALGEFKPVANPKTIAVQRVGVGDAAKTALLESIAQGAGKDSIDALVGEMTGTLETALSKRLGLPVVPGGGASGASGTGADQFIAAIPDCMNSGGESFALPVPSYRFFLTLDQVASGEFVRQTKRKVVGEQGAIAEEAVSQTEKGYGARFILNLVAPDEADTTEWGGARVLADQKFRFVASKRFTGERKLLEFDQYRRLSLAFLEELATAFMTRDEKWIKTQLSAEMGKTKPSAIRTQWIEVFEKRMGLARAKKK